MCDKYLESYHKETILQILEDDDENKHFSININFVELFENDPNLGSSLLKEPEQNLDDWNCAFKKVQTRLTLQTERNCILKKNTHCRIYGLPICPDLHRTMFPKNDDADKLLQVAGTVVRVTAMKVLEYQRQYICTKCKHVMSVRAEYEKKHAITPPKRCENPEDCKGTNIITTGELDPELCKDYQEIKIQEIVSKLDVGCIPHSMWVTLEDDLVDRCKPGDNITVCGVVKRRWNQFFVGKKMEIELVIKANHIQVNNNNSSSSITTDLKDMFDTFWKTYSDKPLAARDIILKSICPQLFGLYVVKLATAVTLAGGSRSNDNSNTGVRIRAEPHLLLVGDPGTGKSQLLRFAAKIVPRSVLTTGVGSTAAGLTVTAIMENGEWQLEGGALVLADGGICCIDEFNSMKEHDRTSIHEAMEQQTISVAKASIVCKLSTRCSILAATNPKGNIDTSQPLSMNIALASPLLSRFDLILLLRDKINEDWDTLVADYILNSQKNSCKLVDNIHWTVETLQVYFAAIKKINPVLTEDSNKILRSYYQVQRRKDGRNKARTTVRLLDSLVRLSQGHARLMYHKEVQVVDAVVAVVLVETAMEAGASVFDLQFDVQSDFPANPMETYRELLEIVLKKLHLEDLLQQELDSLEKKMVSNTVDAKVENCENQETESRFFQFQQGPARGDGKDVDTDQFDKKPVDILRIKRTKSKNSPPPKKVKLDQRENDVINDLAALDCIPSVFDVPSLNGEDEDDLQVERDADDEFENCKECETVPVETVNTKTDDTGKEKNAVSDVSMYRPINDEEVNDQDKTIPKCRKKLNRFRLITKEPNPSDHNQFMSKDGHREENTGPENQAPKSNNLILSDSLQETNILKELEVVPQSTQQMPRFKFKKHNQLTHDLVPEPISHPTETSHTIFESQEELDSIDLDF